TEATLKLLPRPAYAKTLLAPFEDVVAAARAVTEIFKARIVPCACEYMERAAVEAAERRKGVKLPVSGEAVLLIEVDGNDEPLLERDAERIAEICMAAGAPDVYPADDPEKRKFVWDLRRSIGVAAGDRARGARALRADRRDGGPDHGRARRGVRAEELSVHRVPAALHRNAAVGEEAVRPAGDPQSGKDPSGRVIAD